jgi:Fe-Mn family superoxide dismutase
MTYQAEDYSNLIGITGFSDTLLNNHFTLYQGYVKNTNKVTDILARALAEGTTSTPEYAELKRRYGFEFNGMRLHEYYFGNLGGDGELNEKSKLYKKLTEYFGSYEAWQKDFKATSMMRGIGWVILYQDDKTGHLFNQWINEHETGHPSGCRPLLVIDVFEHAFIIDYGLKRADYIAAFLSNINWNEVQNRLI